MYHVSPIKELENLQFNFDFLLICLGLAPVRSSRQDQIHSSIVSTLLALMDGLDNRGQVVVIGINCSFSFILHISNILGATNRIDHIDPGLRRPGRFDRYLFIFFFY